MKVVKVEAMDSVSVSDLEIRLFKPRDLEDILNIENQCFKPEHRYDEHMFRRLYKLYSDCFYVAVINGRVVGYVICGYIEDFGHIISIAVEPGHQGKGIGWKLLSKAEEVLQSKGVRVVYLEVGVSNSKAIKLYLRNGYVPVTKLDNYYGDEDAYLMVKRLRSYNGV